MSESKVDSLLPELDVSIKVLSLFYAFPTGSGLSDVTFSLPARSRTLLVGGTKLML